jgi:hypothetical protein
LTSISRVMENITKMFEEGQVRLIWFENYGELDIAQYSLKM